jgi:Uma2 family endonuclease
MEAVTTLPRGRALTVADLDAMPDDGHRYELIDGALIVTPAPVVRHQRVSMALTRVLLGNLPDDLELLAAPTDVKLADDTAVQPDLLVARTSDLTETNLPGPPLLAVEILSRVPG